MNTDGQVALIMESMSEAKRRVLCSSQAKEEGRPSRWKDGLARSLVHDSTHR